MTPFDAGEVSRVVFLAWFSIRRGQTDRAAVSATAARSRRRGRDAMALPLADLQAVGHQPEVSAS